jgi:hypothetical protein
MHRKPMIMTIVLVLACLSTVQVRAADGPPMPMPGMQPGLARLMVHELPQESRLPYGLKLLVDTIEVNVLAELTGLPLENIRQLLICAPPARILDAYDVSPEAFASAMDKHSAKLINQSLSAGLITKTQYENIMKRINNKPMRPCPRLDEK